jgi:hypothetical protein
MSVVSSRGMLNSFQGIWGIATKNNDSHDEELKYS